MLTKDVLGSIHICLTYTIGHRLTLYHLTIFCYDFLAVFIQTLYMSSCELVIRSLITRYMYRVTVDFACCSKAVTGNQVSNVPTEWRCFAYFVYFVFDSFTVSCFNLHIEMSPKLPEMFVVEVLLVGRVEEAWVFMFNLLKPSGNFTYHQV
jgi:hypothetical protein